MNIGVVGAGITGTLCALALAEKGHSVKLFEKDHPAKRNGCSVKAAGLLAPGAELLTGGLVIGEKGLMSLKYWEKLVRSHPLIREAFYPGGSLYLSLPKHEALTWNFYRRCQKLPELANHMKPIKNHEPIECLDHSPKIFNGYFLEREAHVHPEKMLSYLNDVLKQSGVDCFYERNAFRLLPDSIEFENHEAWRNLDCVVDCRGLASDPVLHDLRGVKGEMLQIRTDEPHLISNPVHFFHERWPVYMVPLDQHHVRLGATQFDSDRGDQIAAGSLFDLLISPLNIFPWLRDGFVTGLISGLRPAFQSNRPSIKRVNGVVCVNGLYRYGFLLGPLVAKNLVWFISQQLSDEISLGAMQ